MSSPPLCPTGRLRSRSGIAYAELDWIAQRTCEVDGQSLDIMQAFFRTGVRDDAYDALIAGERLPADFVGDGQLRAARTSLDADAARIVIGRHLFSIVAADGPPVTGDALPMDARGVAQRWNGLLRWLLLAELHAPGPTRSEFDERVDELTDHGLLAPRPAGTALSDGLPRRPLCQLFGMQRGTPIDRYYLARFIDEARPHVTPAGRVLDIGGQTSNRREYCLTGVRRYDALNIVRGPGTTVVADAAERTAVAPSSVDTVLLFNMLEHCPEPQAVVDNVHEWLVPGGTCLAMVPGAQRLHNFPADYWRPTPDGLASLFKGYHEIENRSYGNLATAIGSLAGLAAEEFDNATLDEYLPDYPVAACVRAGKRDS